jgi:uncharacterized membrane protein YphA (DoxX/SURF4 family)
MLGAGLLLLGAVFLLAGAAKLREREAFARTLTTLVPARSAPALVIGVPLAELALGGLLVSGLAPRAGAALALAALLAFSLALLLLHRRAPRSSCGCFGDARTTLVTGLARNGLLSGLALALLLFPVHPWVWSPGLAAVALFVVAVFVGGPWLRTTASKEGALGGGGGLLAGPQTRRGFFGRMAFAGAAVGVAAAARDPERALGAGAPSGCMYGRVGVNVCYMPFKVLRSEPASRLPPGHRGVAVRKGPSPDAPIVYKGGRPVVIPVGEWFGRQSGRDGGASRGCPPPPPRPEVTGFVVGYPDILGTAPDKTGWIALSYGGETFAREDPTCPHIMCGPASLDFDCRGGTDDSSPYRSSCGHRAHGSKKRTGYACGGTPEDPGTCFPPRESVVQVYRQKHTRGLVDDLSKEYYNLKYTEDGTTTHWLVPGDRVREYCIKCVRENPDPTCPPNTFDRHQRGCCQSYSCVEVLQAKWVPSGTRGWVGSAVLADKGVPPPLRASLDRVVKDVLFLGGG